jgi:hypothetical protein
MQADHLNLPINIWGQFARSRKHPGTVHFYTDDYRFNGLWHHPEKVVNAGCLTAVEPNFSTSNSQPFPVALYSIYKKRFIARYWQEQGIKILVDLSIAQEHEDLNMLGVPLGWRAYATTTHEGFYEAALIHQYELACAHAGSEDILFCVITRSKVVQKLCQEMGWQFVRVDHYPERIKIRPEKSLEKWMVA